MVAHYRGHISGPRLDRIDIQVGVPAVDYRDPASDVTAESSPVIRRRVLAARDVQCARWDALVQRSHTGGEALNARLPTGMLRKCARLDSACKRLLGQAIDRLGLSARAHDRILRVSRTIADLAGRDRIDASHLAEAIQYRSLDRKCEGKETLALKTASSGSRGRSGDPVSADSMPETVPPAGRERPEVVSSGPAAVRLMRGHQLHGPSACGRQGVRDWGRCAPVPSVP